MKRVIAYTRISRADRLREQSLGIDAQRAAILAAAVHHGWEIVGWYTDDGVSGRTLHRPGITAALAELKAHRADGMVAAKLDRLSRSVADFASLLDTSRRQGWDVAVLDFQLDTSSATGRFIAGMLAQFAQFEREVIAERTRAALAVRKAEGVTLGKPSTIPVDVQARIVAAHRAGQTFSAIARTLDADAVPTPGGSARWHHSVVAGVVRRATLIGAPPRDQHRADDQPRHHAHGRDDLDDQSVRLDEHDHEADRHQQVEAPHPPGSAPELAAHGRERTEAVPA